MTRDEAISHLLKYAPDLGDSVSNSFVLRLIEDIYDDFESMTCGNCKYEYNGACMHIGDWDCYNDDFCDWIPPDDFGCNKFENKDK